MKANKRKVWECLKCVKDFLRRLDLAKRKKEITQRNNMIQSKEILTVKKVTSAGDHFTT